MCSQSSSSTNDWQGKLYFISDANTKPGIGHLVPLNKIREIATDEDLDEKIESVSSYKGPLMANIRPFSEFFHRFIIIKTSRFWWSVEKNKMVIVLQKSLIKDDVLKQCDAKSRGQEDSLIEEEKEIIVSNVKMEELFEWLENNGDINAFHLLMRNCKKFGKDVFSFLKGKTIRQERTFPKRIYTVLNKYIHK